MCWAPISSRLWIAVDHEQNQWSKILLWGDNSLSEFYVSLPIEANEKKQLAYWGEQNWLIKVFMFIILNKDLYKPDKAREWIQ